MKNPFRTFALNVFKTNPYHKYISIWSVHPATEYDLFLSISSVLSLSLALALLYLSVVCICAYASAWATSSSPQHSSSLLVILSIERRLEMEYGQERSSSPMWIQQWSKGPACGAPRMHVRPIYSACYGTAVLRFRLLLFVHTTSRPTDLLVFFLVLPYSISMAVCVS